MAGYSGTVESVTVHNDGNGLKVAAELNESAVRRGGRTRPIVAVRADKNDAALDCEAHPLGVLRLAYLLGDGRRHELAAVGFDSASAGKHRANIEIEML